MSQRLPEFIEPLRLAESGRSLSGRIPLARFHRLAESLSSSEGEVDVVMDFGLDEQGRPCLLARIRVRLQVLCQRCLEPMDLPMELETRLQLVTSEGKEQALPEGFEALVVSESPFFLADIVEDELILALPLVPMHPDDICPARAKSGFGMESDSENRESPFAVLETLKTKKP